MSHNELRSKELKTKICSHAHSPILSLLSPEELKTSRYILRLILKIYSLSVSFLSLSSVSVRSLVEFDYLGDCVRSEAAKDKVGELKERSTVDDLEQLQDDVAKEAKQMFNKVSSFF